MNQSDFMRQLANDLKEKAGSELSGCKHCDCSCGEKKPSDADYLTAVFLQAVDMIQKESGDVMALVAAKKSLKELRFDIDMRENDMANNRE